MNFPTAYFRQPTRRAVQVRPLRAMHRFATLSALAALSSAVPITDLAALSPDGPIRQAGRVVPSVTTRDGQFTLAITARPDPVPPNEPFELQVEVRPATPIYERNPVWLDVQATMPAHGHGMNTRIRIEDTGNGRFVVRGLLFHMAGDWELLFQVAKGRIRDEARSVLSIE